MIDGSLPGADVSRSNNNRSVWLVFLVFLRLGLTSFGGPVAHLGYFRDEFVVRRQWLTERRYADLIALCHVLPGPSSSQVGLALGLSQAGYAGAVAAWAGFTLPSAFAMILLGLSVVGYGDGMAPGVLQGLKVAAVAVVAQAVWAMGRQFCTGIIRRILMAVGAVIVLAIPSAWTPMTIIVMAALAGLVAFKDEWAQEGDTPSQTGGRQTGVLLLFIFFMLLLGLPVLTTVFPHQALAVFDAFYRVGSLVFGGGHVVLPLLQAEVVPAGWVDNDVFLAGYGAAQAVPGPLFTFAAFLGASLEGVPSGWWGGALCLLAIFLPSFLLVAGVLPFWESLRQNRHIRAALSGVNAAVVGLLLAALYNPVFISTVRKPLDIVWVLVTLVALMGLKIPSWLVVVISALVGGVLGFIGY